MKFGSIFRISSGVAVLALLIAMTAPSAAAQTSDSAKVSNLLAQAESHATLLKNDAATLQSFTRSGVSWQSHAGQLEVMKTHVNNLGKVEEQLRDARSEGAPWQQEAIDQINPLLQDMADHLTATINHLNENQGQVHMPPFKDYVHGNYELASVTNQAIKDLVAYDKAKARVEALEQKMGSK